MAKRKRGFTEEKYKKWLKEGRGQGKNNDYQPWLRIQDVASVGNAIRTYSFKTKRQHDFLSNLECNYFYLMEFADKVVDIREQFPLLYREETMAIANELGLDHPKDPFSKVDIVITTDFLLTIKENGKYVEYARTIKPKKYLENKRVIEKFEIERIFWERKNINWGAVTEDEINSDLAKNLEYLRGFNNISDCIGIADMSERNVKVLLHKLMQMLIRNEHESIRSALIEFDYLMNLEVGTSTTLFNHLLYTKQIVIDLSKKLDIDKYQEIGQGELNEKVMS